MATPIGVDDVTTLSRQFVIPEIIDNIYRSNVLFFRLNAANKRGVAGGTQIEVPLMYARMSSGGPYRGFDVLPIAPSDTIKAGALDWKQLYVPVAVDGLTLTRVNHPDAIANFIKTQFLQAQLEMAEWIADGMWSDGTNALKIDGLQAAVDDGTNAATYAALTRSSNTWWKSQYDAATTTLTLAALQSMYGSTREGGRAPTVAVVTQANYNRFWALLVAKQAFHSSGVASDTALANAGFDNILFNGCPVAVDSHVPTNGWFFLNEDYIELAVSERADFFMTDFIEPANQDAMVAKLLWTGNLVFKNVARQGRFTALAA